MSTAWPKLPIAELVEACDGLPGPAHEKRRLRAVVLRCRIERLVIDLPPSVIRGAGSPRQVRLRLLAAVGEPGLTHTQRSERLHGLERAATAYEALCEVLHGDSIGLYPSAYDLAVWERDIEIAELQLAGAGTGI